MFVLSIFPMCKTGAVCGDSGDVHWCPLALFCHLCLSTWPPLVESNFNIMGNFHIGDVWYTQFLVPPLLLIPQTMKTCASTREHN